MLTPGLRRRSYVPRLIEIIAVAIARVLYRVRAGGVEHVPATGGVLLIVNHLSYIDPVVLQLACPRPIRFLGYQGLRENILFDWAFRLSGSIPISRTNSTDGIRRVIKALQFNAIHGEVCPANWEPGSLTIKAEPAASKEYFQQANR